MQHAHTFLKRYWIAILVALIALAMTAGYFLGYRIDGSGIVQVGAIEIQGIPDSSSIYIDEARRVVSKGDTTRIALRPGTHSIIVDVDGMQPWNELASVRSNETTVLVPIEVSKGIARERLPQEQYAEGRAAISAMRLPTEAAPLLLDNGCISVYVSGPRILASATSTPGCAIPEYLACVPADAVPCPPTLVFAPSSAMRSIVKYPGREDALVVSAGTLSYVLELDPRKPQFFAPITRGNTYSLAPWTDDSLLIDDAGTLYTLPL